MNTTPPTDPFVVLGISPDADEGEVRARYLALVKQFPPERDPEKFNQIRQAFEAAKDPLTIARHLLTCPEETVPQWAAVLQAQQKKPPNLSVPFLLSLGNRAASDSDTV